jgi:hypothetical protein
MDTQNRNSSVLRRFRGLATCIRVSSPLPPCMATASHLGFGLGKDRGKLQSKRRAEGVDHQKSRIHEPALCATDRGAVNPGKARKGLVGHALPLPFLRKYGGDGFRNFICVVLAQRLSFEARHSFPKRADMHVCRSPRLWPAAHAENTSSIVLCRWTLSQYKFAASASDN